MFIREAMTSDVRTIAPTATIREAAEMMIDLDVGALPVAEGDRLIGMITDRDIAVRAIALGKDAKASVAETMTPEVKYCFDDDDVEDVAENMAEIQVRRLPVVSRAKRLVGIVSLADLATKATTADCGLALEGIARPGGQHTQSADGLA